MGKKIIIGGADFSLNKIYTENITLYTDNIAKSASNTNYMIFNQPSKFWCFSGHVASLIRNKPINIVRAYVKGFSAINLYKTNDLSALSEKIATANFSASIGFQTAELEKDIQINNDEFLVFDNGVYNTFADANNTFYRKVGSVDFNLYDGIDTCIQIDFGYKIT